MAIITYQCDVCKRSIDLPQNKEGMEAIGQCRITDQCKGTLHQIDVKLDHLVGQVPPEVEGLNNWVPRRLFYKHNQTVPSKQWKVEHNLGTHPAIQVHRLTGSTYVEFEPKSIEYVDINNALVTFNVPETGVVQCIARSVNESEVKAGTVAAEQIVWQLGVRGEHLQYDKHVIAIATKDSITDPITSELVFYSLSSSAEITTHIMLDFWIHNPAYVTDPTFDPTLGSLPANHPWFNITKILLNGKVYTVRYASYTDLDSSTYEEGSTFRLQTSITDERDAFFLLAYSPHAEADKTAGKIIDFTSMKTQASAAGTSITNDELIVSDSHAEVIYPDFRFLQN